VLIKSPKELVPLSKSACLAADITVFKDSLNNVVGIVCGKRSAKFPIARKLKIGDSIDPSEVRNDFYVTLKSGSFQQDGKRSQRNVQIRLRVVNSAGITIENSIIPGMTSGTVSRCSEYLSSVFYHENNPVWDEIVKIDISSELMDDIHLLFTVWHVSSKPKNDELFSFGFLPVSVKSIVVANGEHVLELWKPFSRDITHDLRKAFYVCNTISLSRRKEEVRILTQLSSTTKPQNEALVLLLKWRSVPKEVIPQILEKIEKVQGTELIQFMREVLDALFCLLAEDHRRLEEQIFASILNVLDQLTSKFSKYRSAVEAYLSHSFRFCKIHSILLRISLNYVDYVNIHSQSPDTKKLKSLMTLCKCLKYVVQLMLTSWRLEVRQSKYEGKIATSHEEFRTRLFTVRNLSSLLLSSSSSDKSVVF
jgi:dedicator of cytokinesis protein 3